MAATSQAWAHTPSAAPTSASGAPTEPCGCRIGNARGPVSFTIAETNPPARTSINMNIRNVLRDCQPGPRNHGGCWGRARRCGRVRPFRKSSPTPAIPGSARKFRECWPPRRALRQRTSMTLGCARQSSSEAPFPKKEDRQGQNSRIFRTHKIETRKLGTLFKCDLP
jgi:hypothetical protein